MPPERELVLPISELKAELFRALSHPARIRILEALATREQSVSEMQPEIGIELSHLSQQLGVLRRAGLVVTRKEGQSVYYSLKNPQMTDLLKVAKQLLISSLTETRDLLADLHAQVNR
ncbi:MAG: metalloregulator ArsR/SmtB family transcription factor [Actinomycetota bacterium]|nr:metalloregulator ArsR/SmtB family transcription factor [Actinomycetota bacterium]